MDITAETWKASAKRHRKEHLETCLRYGEYTVDTIHERRQYQAALETATEELHLARKALRAVEWVNNNRCPFCQGISPDHPDKWELLERGITWGHKPGCLRQRGLGVEGGEE